MDSDGIKMYKGPRMSGSDAPFPFQSWPQDSAEESLEEKASCPNHAFVCIPEDGFCST